MAEKTYETVRFEKHDGRERPYYIALDISGAAFGVVLRLSEGTKWRWKSYDGTSQDSAELLDIAAFLKQLNGGQDE